MRRARGSERVRVTSSPGRAVFGPRPGLWPRGTRRSGHARLAHSARPRRGLTMVEAAACTVLVALLLTAALHTAAAAKVTHTRAAEMVQGQTLAQGLLSEVMQKAFFDPSVTDAANPGPMGVEAGEDPARKTTFNDVDDYRDWAEAPPQDPQGNVLAGREGWRREVAVQWLDPADLATVRGTATEAKRVSVTVTHNGRPIAVMSAVRTNAP
jgi:hypothetical protein